MTSTIQTVARLGRRAAFLMIAQTLAACGAAQRIGTRPQPTATETAWWPIIDAASYRLQVTGLVAAPLSLTVDQLQSLPRSQAERVLTCSGAFLDKAVWSGASLDRVLDLAAPLAGAATITLVAADQYERSLPLGEAAGYVLAQERAGELLAEKHGFPLRVVAPTEQGYEWVRWLAEIRVS